MGTWSLAIMGNDTSLDVYDGFFDEYNGGEDPAVIRNRVIEDINYLDDLEYINSLYGLALALWEVKALDKNMLDVVTEYIHSGYDLLLYCIEGLSLSDLEARDRESYYFLEKISKEKKYKVKRQASADLDYGGSNILAEATSPGGSKRVVIDESFYMGKYAHTGGSISWPSGGGYFMYYKKKGSKVSVSWKGNNKVIVRYDKDVVFSQKDNEQFFCGDIVEIKYIKNR